MRKVGNPGKDITQTEKVSTYVTPEVNHHIVQLAKKYDISISSWLRKIIHRELLKERIKDESHDVR